MRTIITIITLVASLYGISSAFQNTTDSINNYSSRQETALNQFEAGATHVKF